MDITFSDNFICSLNDKHIHCFSIHFYRNPALLGGWEGVYRTYNYIELTAVSLGLGFGIGIGSGLIQTKLNYLLFYPLSTWQCFIPSVLRRMAPI
jgi:hypothetical protein